MTEVLSIIDYRRSIGKPIEVKRQYCHSVTGITISQLSTADVEIESGEFNFCIMKMNFYFANSNDQYIQLMNFCPCDDCGQIISLLGEKINNTVFVNLCFPIFYNDNTTIKFQFKNTKNQAITFSMLVGGLHYIDKDPIDVTVKDIPISEIVKLTTR